ncbi:hypothetical protein MMC07_001034 [Pseudocyphellaria aurata]|nr:hypothetical protein [Pseudocyphellaria aurata]
MDEISDDQKLAWLTTTLMPRARAMITKETLQVRRYRVTIFQRQIRQPSFGYLGKLPLELLCVVFRHLTCEDLEALHSCSTGGRLAVLAFPQYGALLRHAPTLLAVLMETGLARSFTITHIYETFVSSLCTNCGHFGGYVFLPSFSRCCMHCAETNIKFLPISRDGAKNEFGVKGKRVFDSLPQLSVIEGDYSSFHGEIKFYTQRLTLFSREMVEKLRNPKHELHLARYSQKDVGDNSVKAHQRYMALTPLPCFLPKSASMEKGLYCAGCALRAKEHTFCQGIDLNECREFQAPKAYYTDGFDYCCRPKGHRDQCLLLTEQDRLHDSRHILSHIEGCAAAQVLLKKKWTRWQEKNQQNVREIPVSSIHRK